MSAYTALANPNIAFIKYWGNRDNALRLLSMGLSHAIHAIATLVGGEGIQSAIEALQYRPKLMSI
jgi:hypothetical protein